MELGRKKTASVGSRGEDAVQLLTYQDGVMETTLCAGMAQIRLERYEVGIQIC